MTLADTDENKFSRLRGADEFKALKLIEANGRLVDGCFVYNVGWSDFKIARDIGCNEGAIARRRTEIFGPLKRVTVGGGAEAKEMAAEIEALKSQAQAMRVDNFRLTQRVEALEKNFNVLLTAPNQEALREKLADLRKHFSKSPATS